MTYLITFTAYGCHLHGDESGSVDRGHNLPGNRVLDTDPQRESAEIARMNQMPYQLDTSRHQIVLAAIRERCTSQSWHLFAAHVRATHVHLVIDADSHPNRIMNDLKPFASRCLNRSGLESPLRKRWTRHGSTRWLWRPESVSAAIRYVIDEQGVPMAVFEIR
jgi:REP element-mobilizing transposase RayT